ncbi:MAG: hypothetical protein HYX27_12285 [Acidobacteria bacterium]|nr:hypothetical protein [Acidobacteriota bacterium]
MQIHSPAVLLLLALAGARGAAGSSLDDLLDRLEQTSRNQAPLAHIDTLISAAELLPPGERRKYLLKAAVSLLGAIREEEPRYFYLAAAAHLIAKQDREEAESICLRIPPRQSPRWRADYRGRCWQFLALSAKNKRATVLKGLQTGAFQIPAALDLINAAPEDGGEILQALMTSFPGPKAAQEDVALLDKSLRSVAPFNLGLAREAALRLRTAPPPPPKPDREPEEPEQPDRAEELFAVADDLSLPPGERSTLLVKVLDATPAMKSLTRRLQLQSYLTAWFTSEGATGTATKAADFLNNTLSRHCHGEGCLESVDGLVEFIVQNRIDPENLRVRHPSLAARLLLRELRIQLER